MDDSFAPVGRRTASTAATDIKEDALEAAAGMLGEREGLELVAAEADLIGHLRDAFEILSINE